ncbi:hypothetical protein L226DRAFT_560466 [Lentinus tigrinus ALCF2SS1-7]|uniref:Uncharacterized protein n=1 Tax=Lentinus tigrinus ALCF2SS1-6 TaxID=1328759 RepID=A0A5C2S885_9APHY|nr:hypothetical protein L227DRAFT_601040 [Lentinus tigrinus ALCF2SS1-6]RPD74799.1 hypothetical protein L226DRAFT_560466 [Lentinus tigrinus ALCF2SS1-7]
MAVALHAKILAEGYTSGMLRAARSATSGAAEILHQQFMTKLEAPQPQKKRADFAQILDWEPYGQEIAVSPPGSGRNHRRLQCLNQVYIESVLSQSHARLRRREFDIAWTTASRRTASNGVNSWPLAPTQPASALKEEPQLLSSAVKERESNTNSPSHPVSQWTVPSECADVPSINDIEALGTRPEGSPNSFIDSDGLEWPLPPLECFVSPVPDVPAHRTTPGGHAQWAPAFIPASTVSVELPSVSRTSFAESDRFDRPLPPQGCMASPVFDMPLPRTGAQARADRTSDCTPPLVDDACRTSSPPDTASPMLPVTPVNENDECHKPCAVPPGVGVIGEGRPSRGPMEHIASVRRGSTSTDADMLPALRLIDGLKLFEECVASEIGFPTEAAGGCG